MKTIVYTASIVAAQLLATLRGQAQGTLSVSNLGETSTGSASVGADSWIAQEFVILDTDQNTYFLKSIELLMNPSSGNPAGFSVSIYSSLNPADNVGTLSGPYPSNGGTYTYTASDILLSSGDFYVVVTAATPISQGAYNWSAAMGATENGTIYIDDDYYSSADGSSWTGHARGDVFQMAIDATAVPEAPTILLMGLGAVYLSLSRRKLSFFDKAL